SRREAGITEPITAGDLSDTGTIKKLSRQAASQNQYAEVLEKEILPTLKAVMEQTEAETLTDLTRLAHAGDYLLAGLEDLRKNADPSYSLWMESLPHYYEKDLRRMELVRTGVRARRIPLTEWITNLDQHLPCCETTENEGATLAVRPVRKERRRGRLGINRWSSQIQ
ncbi:MAG: hypothetical protein HY760_01160, partial [Nitrospirae bacterium]|nr:hypothetical protein [Nitrospirota bacterium]